MYRKFVDPRVQKILKNVTGLNLEKVFQPKPINKLSAPKYLFLTDEDFQKSIDIQKKKAKFYLRMPPVLEEYKDKELDILEKDEKLAGYVDDFGHSNYNLVFVDISQNQSNRARSMVVREPDGTLRRASFKERQRLNSIYFPFNYRTVDMPKMFEPENLEKLLEKKNTSFFILERACLQFDPDDSDYIRVTNKVYEFIYENKLFDELRSTRHFGPFVFYLTINKKLDLLIKDMQEKNLKQDILDIEELYKIIHNEKLSNKI